MLKSVVYSNLSPTIRCHGNVTLSLVSGCVTDEFHDSKNPIFIILFIYLNQTTYGSINIQNKQNTCKQENTDTHTHNSKIANYSDTQKQSLHGYVAYNTEVRAFLGDRL